MKVLVLDGPNLNMLGKRDPAVYGSESLEQIHDSMREKFPEVSFEFFQSNHEGQLIDKIHTSFSSIDALIINPGALAHYSIALHDAIEICSVPVVEVHLSNISAREEFRHKSVISPVCTGIIGGFGKNSYLLAVHAVIHELRKKGA